MGIAGPVNKKKIEDPRKILDAKGIAKADGTLLIDYVAKPISFRLRDEIKENCDQIVSELKAKFPKQMPGDIADSNEANSAMSYYLVAQGGPQGEVCLSACKGPDSDDQWPYDLRQIAKRYEDMLGNEKGVETVVLVADTGLDRQIQRPFETSGPTIVW